MRFLQRLQSWVISSGGRQARMLFTAIVGGLLPMILARPLLRALGHKVSPGASIGFSLLLCPGLSLGRDVRIGHLNAVAAKKLVMRSGAVIGHANVIRGPLSILMDRRAAIGNTNRIVRAPRGPVTIGPSMVRLGELTKITSGHYVDGSCSVSIGDFSILAGVGSQIWTHGYVHDREGAGRYRIDGEVQIGANVYIGSRCIVTAGVRIADGAMVGAGTTVARDLPNASLYVAGPLRELPRPPAPEQRSDLELQRQAGLTETVYRKSR